MPQHSRPGGRVGPARAGTRSGRADWSGSRTGPSTGPGAGRRPTWSRTRTRRALQTPATGGWYARSRPVDQGAAVGRPYGAEQPVQEDAAVRGLKSGGERPEAVQRARAMTDYAAAALT